jgi:hypothetical protein
MRRHSLDLLAYFGNEARRSQSDGFKTPTVCINS